MRVFSRALPLLGALLSVAALSACGGGGSAGSTGAGATTMSQSAAVMPQIVSISPTEKLGFIPASASALRDAVPAGTPPVINAWVSLSSAINGLPCFQCAGNPPIPGSLGIAFPSPYLPHTGGYELTYTFYNVSEGTNSCTLTFNFLQGATSLLHYTTPIKLNGNGQYFYFVGGSLPSSAKAGPGTANANVTCNGFTPKAASQKVILH